MRQVPAFAPVPHYLTLLDLPVRRWFRRRRPFQKVYAAVVRVYEGR